MLVLLLALPLARVLTLPLALLLALLLVMPAALSMLLLLLVELKSVQEPSVVAAIMASGLRLRATENQNGLLWNLQQQQ